MPPGAATAPVDMPEAQVRQVLGNLLDNAAAHGKPPCVVSLAVRQGVAVLVVHDDGPGIDHDFLPLAAGRFGGSAAARAGPGASLGLSLVQTLVDHYGGELRLCSAGVHHRYAAHFDVPCQHPASGTSASVLLPIVG
ncbi:MAG: ykoH [Jatrophihabitantaceae bacterium]|nr:ykoH [Jatrophihabitantaceae bacterium]